MSAQNSTVPQAPSNTILNLSAHQLESPLGGVVGYSHVPALKADHTSVIVIAQSCPRSTRSEPGATA